MLRGTESVRLWGARRIAWLLVAAATAALCGASTARAANTYTVTTATDADTGSCTASQCTLRDAVLYSSAGDTVNVPAGTYTLSSGELAVNHDLQIVGAGARSVTISGNDASRVFNIASGVTATITGVTVTHGASGIGGAFAVTGTLSLSDSAVTNSSAPDGGGGIAVAGTLDLKRSTVTGNTSPNTDSCACGGGIALAYGNSTATITNSTITGNSAGAASGSFARGEGGGIYGNGTLTVVNSTIANNTAFPGGTTTVAANVYGTNTKGGFQNTIIASPQGGGVNCVGLRGAFPPSNGNNLEDDTAQTCKFTQSSDQSGVDPKLGTLANNGGPTDTMALQAGSPAIDKGATVASVTTDQRGVSRPQGPAYDIGAYEALLNADLGITKTASPSPATVGQTLTYTLKATNSGPADATGVTVTDTLPASVTFKSAGASQGSCSQSSGTVTCSLGTLANGASATVTIAVTPKSTGSVTNTAKVSGSSYDPNSANNTASTTTQVTAAPQAVTNGASGVTFTKAIVHGSVNPGGVATTYYFQYGKTTKYGSKTSSQSAGSGTSFQAVSRGLSGLQPGTLYHYRVVAVNANGTAEGQDRTFRTPSRRSLHVNPGRVLAGARVRVAGNAEGCPVGDQVTLMSRAFSNAHNFAGVPAIYATVHRGGSFSTFTRVPVGRSSGAYVVTARCGGGNVGVSATLTVYHLPRFTG